MVTFLINKTYVMKLDVTMSKVLFEFTHWDNKDNIIECNVQILTDETQGSSNRKVNNFENVSTMMKTLI